MSLDLTLLPFDCDHGEKLSFSHTVLGCERRRELFEEILEVPALPVPSSFSSYLAESAPRGGERCYGTTTNDPYGNQLCYTQVEELLALRDHAGVADNWKNKAIWAYLAHLPPQTKVALYWC